MLCLFIYTCTRTLHVLQHVLPTDVCGVLSAMHFLLLRRAKFPPKPEDKLMDWITTQGAWSGHVGTDFRATKGALTAQVGLAAGVAQANCGVLGRIKMLISGADQVRMALRSMLLMRLSLTCAEPCQCRALMHGVMCRA